MERNQRRIDWDYDVFSQLQNIGDEILCLFSEFPEKKLYPALCKRNKKCKKYVSKRAEDGIVIQRIC